ncbi:MAG: hypothetical protein H0X66_11050 [Verrucomicrobia bacterium]|nr:hypothetical protein [Verrucomicrobiota bacterium]
MALVLIKEDGTAKIDANSYASAADADAYFDGHLYATVWTAAVSGTKEAALVMATRLIDSQYQFGGSKRSETQALQWPRENCRDLDAGRWTGGVVASDVVPKGVIEATCEMARELLILDRTTAPPGEGLKYQNIGSDQVGYSKTDVRPIISHVAQAMLIKYGALVKKSGAVRLVRV